MTIVLFTAQRVDNEVVSYISVIYNQIDASLPSCVIGIFMFIFLA